MLIVCPNCATSYGAEMASLRPAKGWTRQVRCSRCRWVWQAELSYADRLLLIADAVLPVRRAMLAAAQAVAQTAVQAAVDAARSRMPRLRATTVLAAELETPRMPADQPPISLVGIDTGPASAARARAAAIRLTERLSTLAVRIVGAVRSQAWWLSRCRSWCRSWWLSWRVSWRACSRLAWRASWWPSWRPALSRLQCLILVLTLADLFIIVWRADLVWAMPQTASFYAALGLPVNLRGVDFDRLAARAERHDGEPVLIVQGEIGNSTTASADVPQLRFAIRNAEHQEIYSWTAAPARGRLSAGARLAFRSELALPPPDTRDVVVRFIDREKIF